MDHSIQLLSELYDLSMTNLRFDSAEGTAKAFIQKLLSKRSLQAGSVWMTDHVEDGQVFLEKIYSTPECPTTAILDLNIHQEGIFNTDGLFLDFSLINERTMKGQYAYFWLNDFGLLELFYNGSTNIEFTKKTFVPFLDVFAQFALSLDASFFNKRLHTEIEQRKMAEKSLKNNQEKYRRIIDNIQLGLVEVDNNEVVQYANKPFQELTGYSLDDLVGKKPSELLIQSDAKIVSQDQSPVRTKGKSNTYEVKIKNKQGLERWLIISGAPNYNQEGELIGSIGIHLNITEQKKLKLENEFKTTQLERIFEKSLDAMISVNSEGEIFEWSPQAEVLFGYTKQEIVGMKLRDTIIPQDRRDGHEKGMMNYLQMGHEPVLNNRIETVGMKISGETFPIELTVFALEYDEEKYFTAIIRDITEIKKSKETVERALNRQKELNNMKSQFISTTSHELRTPLTTIKSNTELLNYQLENMETLKPERLLKNVKRIEDNVDRLNQLINNILMIGKLDSDKVPFAPVNIDVYTHIKEKILPDFESRNTLIHFEKEGLAREVALDIKLFRHIMTNLIENAIKYSPDAEAPQLKLYYEETEITLHVIDFGIGIPAEDIGKLFDTFYRATNVDNIQGTGLGLSIVHQFVMLHNGSIKVESEVGKGSVFILNFPYTQIKEQL